MNNPDQDPKRIFGEALALTDPTQRARYLERACAANPELRREVESLLRAHEQAGNFLPLPGPAPELALETPGTVIGRYKLLEKIGEGGFGVVWMAEQAEPLRRRVALKIIKLGMDTREVVARFEAERQALAMMDHPNIATVFDGGATDTGRPYFVMELVKGVPITDYCDAHRLSTRERLGLFVRVCQAVQHAHQKGVIHRDLKPSNILVTLQEGRPVSKVIDFGVAKATQARLTEQTQFTRFHQWIGTPAYMSPEQAGRAHLDVDTRSDVYSLGVLLYELLTGRMPFDTRKLLEGGHEAVMRSIREQEPPKPSTRISTLAEEELSTVAARRDAEPGKLRRMLRGDLDWIVMKALEKDRTRRYDTANALALDVERHLNHESVNAVAPTLSYQLGKFILRHRQAAVWTAVCAFLLVAGTALSVREAMRADRARAVAEKREAEARENLWASYLATARASRTSGQPGRRFAALEAVAKAAAIRPSLELRNEAASALALVDIRTAREWEGRLPDTSELVLDPRFERYARNDGRGNVTLRRVSDDRELLSLADGLAPDRFSPDGRYLLGVVAQPPRFGVWNLEMGRLTVDSPSSVYCPGPDFHPHAPILAACGAAGTVDFFDVAAGTHWAWPATNIPPGYVRFRPDGKRLAVASWEPPVVRIYEVDSGRLVSSLVHSNAVRRVDWSPDGDWLAAPCADGRVFLWDMREGGILDRILEGHDDVVSGVCFDPQGEFLISQSWDSTTALWSLASRSLVLRMLNSDYPLAFSADGRWLGPDTTGRTMRLLEVVRVTEHRILPANAEAECNGAFSPDGRWVVVGGDGVQCWEVSSGRRRWTESIGHVRYVAFRPGGGTLLTVGETGAREWPWRVDPATGLPKLGSPRRLTAGRSGQADYSRDGSVLVIAQHDGLWVSDAQAPAPKVLPKTMCNYASVSPDGRWAAGVALGGGEGGMKVWDRPGGREVFQLANVRPAIGFTRDGRWLMVGGHDVFRCLEVGTWRSVGEVAMEDPKVYAQALSADSRWIAVEQGRRGHLALYEIPTLRPLLAWDTFGGWALPLCISPDGTLLLTSRTGGNFGIWDLRRLREELTALGLGW